MELLDLYDSKKQLIGETMDRHCGEPVDGRYKLSTHIWIINSKGELLIQKRSELRKTNPNKWGFTGGAVDAGESAVDGAVREAKEELDVNLRPEEVDLLLSFKREYDFVDVFVGKSDIDINNIKLQEDEVSESKWVSLLELDSLIQKDEVVPSIKLYYELFLKLLDKNYGIKKE